MEFLSPKNYKETLKSLSICTGSLAFIYTTILAVVGWLPNQPIDIEIPQDLLEFEISGLKIGSIIKLGVLPALFSVIFFILSRFFELHNKLAKISLRPYWDKKFIISVFVPKKKVSASDAKKIMDVYYKNLERIDSHYVEVFWHYAFSFWILFEFSVLSILIFLLQTIFFEINVHPLKLAILPVVVSIFTWLHLQIIVGPKSTDQAKQMVLLPGVAKQIKDVMQKKKAQRKASSK